MGTDLEVKKVNFMGDELVAIRESDSGKIYVCIDWVCKGLGLNRNQSDNQVRKIKNDKLLFNRTIKKSFETNGIINDFLCIELDFLPAWLFKINANTIKDEVIKEKLLQYQLRAKDILAGAFLPQYTEVTSKDIITQIPKDFQSALRLLADKIDENEKLKPKAEKYDVFMAAKNAQSMNHVAKCLHTGRNKLFKFLREQEILMDDNVPYQRYVNDGYFITRELTVWNGEQSFNTVQTLVTAKGVSFISDLLNKRLPVAQ